MAGHPANCCRTPSASAGHNGLSGCHSGLDAIVIFYQLLAPDGCSPKEKEMAILPPNKGTNQV